MLITHERSLTPRHFPVAEPLHKCGQNTGVGSEDGMVQRRFNRNVALSLLVHADHLYLKTLPTTDAAIGDGRMERQWNARYKRGRDGRITTLRGRNYRCPPGYDQPDA